MIFISYGHDDHEKLIKRFAKDLKNEGFEIWIDYETLFGSSLWEERIENGIAQSSIVIVFMTTHSMRRPDGYCLDEISYSRMLNKTIMPIKVQDVAPPISIARIQWIDMRNYINADGEINEDYYQKQKANVISILRGEKNLSYESDAQYLLNQKLNPLDNESYILPMKRFFGRKWLFDSFEQWLKSESESRVFCIIGQAGSGKTAFVSKLCETHKSVVAIHFCRYNNDERANPKRAITSLAYHLSTQLPDYKEQLLHLNDLDKLQEKNVHRLFEYLFIEPLQKIKNRKEKVVLIIDALDEATKNMRNELIDLIVSDFQKLPNWLNFVVTTRPEMDIERKLKHLNPFVIDNSSSSNLDDIYGFLSINLKPFLEGIKNADELIKTIVKKSQGVFLYASEIVKSVESGVLRIEDALNFPDGLSNIYLNYFERMFILNMQYDYKTDIRPLMEVIAVSLEPLHEDIIKDILNIDDYDFDDIKEYIHVLFPSERGYIEPLHKSLNDWIVDRSLSGQFSISVKKAHERLSNYFYKIHEKGKDTPYIIKYLAKHLIRSHSVEMATTILKDADMLSKRIKLQGQDSGIREYLNDLVELEEISHEDVLDILRSDCFIALFRNNRRYLYNAGLYFKLKELGFDEILLEYEKLDIEVLVGCVNYLYITERYSQSEVLARRLTQNTYDVKYNSLISEVENEIALSCRKLVRFDDALEHCNNVCKFGKDNADYYEVALAHQTIGKILYHRCMWDEAYVELCEAVHLLEQSIPLTTDNDYIKMLKLYVAAFEREVALSMVWKKDVAVAKHHLAHAGEIYDELKAIDRYHIRYLYVDMFAETVRGNYEFGIDLYPTLLKEAVSKYDKSQIEFYYALLLYLNDDTKQADEHINLAVEIVSQIDALIESSVIYILKKVISGITITEIKQSIDKIENSDIKNWSNFVCDFITCLKTENKNDI